MEHRLYQPLKNKLKENKITMEYFTELLGVKSATFNNWIYGKYTMPENIEKLVEDYINDNITMKIRLYLHGEVIQELNWHKVKIERDLTNIHIKLEE